MILLAPSKRGSRGGGGTSGRSQVLFFFLSALGLTLVSLQRGFVSILDDRGRVEETAWNYGILDLPPIVDSSSKQQPSTVPRQSRKLHERSTRAATTPASATTNHSSATTNHPPSTQIEKEDPADQNHFSACLLFMDDNALLVEWLAYHYTTLPLRRLIVAVDPRSKTSPKPVLDRWKGRIDSTIWTDADYADEKLLQARGCHEADKAAEANASEALRETAHWTGIHRFRQRAFMNACTQQLWREHRTWVLHTDTDEYLAANLPPVVSDETHAALWDHVNQRGPTMLRLLETMQAHNATKSMDANRHAMFQSRCLVFPRHEVGLTERNDTDPNLPSWADPTGLVTLRFPVGTGEDLPGKAVLDLRRFPKATVDAWTLKDFRIHAGAGCGGVHHKLAQSHLVVHHYPATPAQFALRKDARGHTDREAKAAARLGRRRKKSRRRIALDHMGTWLADFSNAVGAAAARELLNGAGATHGDHQATPHADPGSTLSYGRCEHWNPDRHRFPDAAGLAFRPSRTDFGNGGTHLIHA